MFAVGGFVCEGEVCFGRELEGDPKPQEDECAADRSFEANGGMDSFGGRALKAVSWGKG